MRALRFHKTPVITSVLSLSPRHSLLLMNQDVSSRLLLQYHAAAMLSNMMAMDFLTL